MNTFLVNQKNNAQRKTLTADEDELFLQFLLQHVLAQTRQA